MQVAVLAWTLDYFWGDHLTSRTPYPERSKVIIARRNLPVLVAF
jgi:hypothetical protein